MRADLIWKLVSATSGVVGTAFLRALLHALADAYGADGAYVTERDGDCFRVRAAWGQAPVEGSECVPGEVGAFAVPLRGSAGDPIGMLVLQAGEPIDPPAGEREVIGLFAERAAAELERRQAEQELRAREAEMAAAGGRLVERADAERRDVGRELHDGAQQRLVVLGQRLDMAGKALREHSGDAGLLIEAARSEVRAVGQELRDLARGLHPTGITHHGLAGALKALASRSSLPVEIAGLPDRRLPDAVEATLYYLVAEAIANAVKHAGAQRMRVDIGFRGGAVVGEIADDGSGGAVVEPGGGLQGLADRLAAVGGELEVISPAGEGTRLVVSIPMQRWRTVNEPFLEFGYQGDEGVGEQTIAQILDGTKTASVSLEREWALEGGPPRAGQRLPVRDYTGREWCVVEVDRVTLLPFGSVGTEAVAAEASGEPSVEAWRAGHRAFYDGCRHELAVLLGEPGWRLTDEEPMVIIWFHLVDGQRPPSQ